MTSTTAITFKIQRHDVEIPGRVQAYQKIKTSKPTNNKTRIPIINIFPFNGTILAAAVAFLFKKK